MGEGVLYNFAFTELPFKTVSGDVSVFPQNSEWSCNGSRKPAFEHVEPEFAHTFAQVIIGRCAQLRIS